MNMRYETQFSYALSLTITGLRAVDASDARRQGAGISAGDAWAIIASAPAEMLSAGRGGERATARLGWLPSEKEVIGLAMAHIGSHFAAALFDLGEPRAKAMVERALEERCMRLVVRGEKDQLLVLPHIGDRCAQVLEAARAARPASFNGFMGTVLSAVGAFRDGSALEAIGVDPRRLQSLTLSVCMPDVASADALVVRPVGEGAKSGLH